MKTIVTHFSPDADAITSVWLLKRFLSDFMDAEVKFVSAGNTLNNEIVDSSPDIVHVDTGMGKLDHHQTDEDTCAAKRTFEYINKILSKKRQDRKNGQPSFNEEVLERMTDVINDIDHFREAYYPNPAADFYDLGFVAILDGWKMLYSKEDERILEMGMNCLDGIYRKFLDKIWAEKEISEHGIPFDSPWGKALGIETLNDEVVRLAQRKGYVLAVRKDPKKGYARIKALPQSGADLTEACTKLQEMDRQATWFLHASKKMVLNGSVKNPDSRPTKLTLREIVSVLKKS